MTEAHYRLLDNNFIITKTAEECSELAQACLAYLTKPVTVPVVEHIDAIASEIADVEIMLALLKRRFTITEKVDNFKAEKVKKYTKYHQEIGDENIGKLRKEE